MDCVFCKIIKGDISSEKIFEDENSFAFLDIKPNSPGHTLLVPKKHARNIFDIPHDTLCALMHPLQKVSHAVKEGVGAGGLNIIMNNEAPSGQIVFHAHFHVIPRFEGDNTKRRLTMEEKERREIAEKIKKFLM